MYKERPLEAYLNDYFSFQTFRPGQREIVQQVLEGGKDVFAVLPTGLGKSICYQLPGMLLPGVTLVVSPLVALMKDQVDGLQAQGVNQATFLNSQLTPGENKRRMAQVAGGRYKLVYAAPERLRSVEFCRLFSRVQVSLVVVDEAHCVSQWGHDFRPDYQWIGRFAAGLPGHPRVLALTATATPKVQDDILNQLGISKAMKITAGNDRPNLYYRVLTVKTELDKQDALTSFLRTQTGCGIIYTATRKECEQVAGLVNSRLRIRAGYYHAGLSPADRTEVQDLFIRERLPVVAATNAFGMGIDKANIRFVVHYSLPASLESYYQEVGRAGRDGEPAECLLLFAPRDRSRQTWMIRNNSLRTEDFEAIADLAPDAVSGRVLRVPFTDSKQRQVLNELERAGYLRLLERDPSGWSVQLLQENPGPDFFENLAHRSRQLTQERYQKLEAISAWATTNKCRRETLLTYFGFAEHVQVGRCCDNCRLSYNY